MQQQPSAPTTASMDVESAPIYPKPPEKKTFTPPPADKSYSKPRNKYKKLLVCLSVTAAVLILLVIIILILRFTIFKPKQPITTINGVSLQDIKFSFDILKLNVHLNATLGVAVSIKNPNRVGFKYANSSVLLDYRDYLIGTAPVPAGDISAGETMPLNLTLTVMTDRLLSDSDTYGDVLAGQVPLTTSTKVSGKVTVLGFVKVRVVASSSCAFVVFLSNRTVGHQHCNYKTQF